MTDLTWQTGAIITLLLLVVVAVAAQVVDEDRRERRKRREVRRAQQLERGRMRMATEHDAEAHAQRIHEAAQLAERSGYTWPDVERLT